MKNCVLNSTYIINLFKKKINMALESRKRKSTDTLSILAKLVADGEQTSKPKKKLKQKDNEPEEKIIESICTTNTMIGNRIKIMASKIYLTALLDYTIVSNVDFTKYIAHIPKELKPLLADRWLYALHVSHGITPTINQNALRIRVNGNAILAYKYTECSISGNDCVYYGFIPTRYMKIPNTHKICHITMMEVWPKKLYVYLKYEHSCLCSKGCTAWRIIIYNANSNNNDGGYANSNIGADRVFCIKKIPWSDIYVIMGDDDETCFEQIKEARACIICASCSECSKRGNFCRKHRKCLHKSTVTFDGKTLSCDKSRIKNCTKYTF